MRAVTLALTFALFVLLICPSMPCPELARLVSLTLLARLVLTLLLTLLARLVKTLASLVLAILLSLVLTLLVRDLY